MAEDVLDEEFFKLLAENVEQSNRQVELGWAAMTYEDIINRGNPAFYVSPEDRERFLALCGENETCRKLMGEMIAGWDAEFHGTVPASRGEADFIFPDEGPATAVIGY